MKNGNSIMQFSCLALCCLLMTTGCGAVTTTEDLSEVAIDEVDSKEVDTNAEVIMQANADLRPEKQTSTDQVINIEEEDVPEAAVPKLLEKKEEQSQEIEDGESVPIPTREVDITLAQEEPILVQVVVEEPAFDTRTLSEGVINRINEIRTAQGLGSLTTTGELLNAANIRAGELSQNFSHQRPNGSDGITVLTEAGAAYGAAGENLFYGYSTVQALENAWSSSDIHRENVLNAGYRHIGVGCVETGKGVFLVQIFTD